MMISKDELCGKIRYRIQKIQFDNEAMENIRNYIYEKYNMPTGTTMDYISHRRPLKDANTFVLFVLGDGIDHELNTTIIRDSFTDIEIREYSTASFKRNEISFPLRITCIPVTADQWIGSMSMKTLMALRDAQLTNYNKNTQRTMQRIVRGNSEFYRISLNYSAIDKIQESIERKTFVPNTITLNIPEDEFDFRYDDKKKELVINSISYFDVTDGYHRLLAMGRIHDKNPNFDYPIEIRITHFAEDKTKQFIYQEDQKTKMRKLDSDSMNMFAQENVLLERMNQNVGFYWAHEIGRNEERINFAEFANVIKHFYYKGNTPKSKSFTYELGKTLVEKLNKVIVDNPVLMEDRVGFNKLFLIIYCIEKFENIEEASKHIATGLNNIEQLKDNPAFTSKKSRKGLYKYIEEII